MNKKMVKKHLQSLKDVIKKMDANLSEDDQAFHASLVLLALTQVRIDKRIIARYTKLDLNFVASCIDNLRDNGVIKGQKIYADWFDKDGGVSFWMDVNVALGFMRRAKSKGA